MFRWFKRWSRRWTQTPSVGPDVFVFAYTHPDVPESRQAVDWLTEHQIPFTEKDIRDAANLRELVARGGDLVPSFCIFRAGAQHMVQGFMPGLLDDFLFEDVWQSKEATGVDHLFQPGERVAVKHPNHPVDGEFATYVRRVDNRHPLVRYDDGATAVVTTDDLLRFI
ncbi:glutaredoxin family protein [Sulfobacillus harzensis]|uniref:Uncharacterized protein n=1 Tax=Sulfobacillus harzensis TaxID=2729629 RepID=A0A7Y0L8R2_9FIRM|nr:hypothetical protein [Sulfobacillus harzensis]NMP25042.1 hypothetical protein [Sulfobacillus harzensis]